MNILKKSALVGAALLALGVNVANAATATGARDPYTDGANAMGKRDPYTDGGRAARDIYTDGAHSMGTHGWWPPINQSSIPAPPLSGLPPPRGVTPPGLFPARRAVCCAGLYDCLVDSLQVFSCRTFLLAGAR